jgi:hypothetical protein
VVHVRTIAVGVFLGLWAFALTLAAVWFVVALVVLGGLASVFQAG